MSSPASQPQPQPQLRRSQRIANRLAAAASQKAAAPKEETQAPYVRMNKERINILITSLMERAVRFCPRGTPPITHLMWYSSIIDPLLSAVLHRKADFTKVDHEALHRCMAFWAEDERDGFIFKTMTPEFLNKWNKCCNLLENIGFHY